MRRKQEKRAPNDFRPLDVVYIFGSVLPGIATGVVAEVDAAREMVSVVPKGGSVATWFQMGQLKRIAGKGGPK